MKTASMVLGSAFILAILLLALPERCDAVVINEILADNTQTIRDQNGNYDDCIELYNPSDQSVRLSGYFLSDRLTNHTKWQFPDTSIAAHSYLIVWADNEPTQTGLHTNFGISRSSESIIFSDAQARIVDSISIGMQMMDVSFGRFPDGSGAFRFMYPTIGYTNRFDGPGIVDPAVDFFGDTTIYRIRLSFYTPKWRDSLQYNFEVLNKQYMPARMIINDTLVLDSIGIRYKGNSSYTNSRNTPKKPLKISFNHYKSDQTLAGMHRLNFHNGVSDPSFLRENLAYKIARRYLPASRTAYADVYVNDTLLGFYSLVEQVDKVFLSKFFTHNGGNLFKASNDGASLQYLGTKKSPYKNQYVLKTNEDLDDWSHFIKLTDLLANTPDSVFIDTLSRYLDLDWCIHALAFNTVLSNYDSYTGSGRNFYLYDDPTSGLFQFIPWDMNEAFGVYTNSWNTTTQEIVNASNLAIRPLVRRIMSNDSLRSNYLRYITEMSTGIASYDSIAIMADAFHAAIASHVLADTNKLYSSQFFIDNLNSSVTVGIARQIPGIKSFIRDRSANIRTQLASEWVYPGDTDDNGVVDAYDIVPLGLYFAAQGTTRTSGNNTWFIQRSAPWGNRATTYADANGDGIVDERDIVAIGINWNCRHHIYSTTATMSRLDPSLVSLHHADFLRIYRSLSGDSEPILSMKKVLEELLEIEATSIVPIDFSLDQNYPNPFNNSTTIRFGLPASGPVKLSIYNALGEKVAEPYVRKNVTAGYHTAVIDARELSSGLYFYRIETNSGSKLRKMVLVK